MYTVSLLAIIENQGQCHSKGQGHLVGQGHQVLRSLKWQWLKVMGHRLHHQVLATTTCASDTLNVAELEGVRLSGPGYPLRWTRRYPGTRESDRAGPQL